MRMQNVEYDWWRICLRAYVWVGVRCVCVYVCVDGSVVVGCYTVMSISVSSCLFNEGCLNLICKLSWMLSVWRSLAVESILKASGSISWWYLSACSRMAEYGDESSRAPVRSLRPRCCAMRFARLHVVCPMYDAAEQLQLYWYTTKDCRSRGILSL